MLPGTEQPCRGGNLASYGPIVHVLNGRYPAAAIKKMTRHGLAKFVTKLVQCTANVAGAKSKKNNLNKPKWWPSGLTFNTSLSLGVDRDQDATVILKQLVVNCSQFFRSYAFKSKWLPAIDRRDFWTENDENFKGAKRKRLDKAVIPNKRRFKAFVEVRAESVEPFVPIEDPPNTPTSCGPPTQSEFMQYFELDGKDGKGGARRAPAGLVGTAKLTNCANIPFSSDVGKIMAQREHHHMPEALKLRRLERSEWYTNKAAAKTASSVVEYEQAPSYKEPPHSHRYKAPKRQHHYKRRSLHDVEFLSRFCTPVSVLLERMDFGRLPHRVTSDKCRRRPKKQLIVLVKDLTRSGREVQKNETNSDGAKTLRSSPRLRRA